MKSLFDKYYVPCFHDSATSLSAEMSIFLIEDDTTGQ